MPTQYFVECIDNKLLYVYIVGDLIWENADPLKYLDKLNGKKVLIIGNHDKKWLNKCDY